MIKDPLEQTETATPEPDFEALRAEAEAEENKELKDEEKSTVQGGGEGKD